MKKQGDETSPLESPDPVSLRELGVLLVKHYNLHDGFYDISVEFGLGVGPVGQTQETLVPGVMIGVEKVGLIAVPKDTPMSANIIDAARVNPKVKTPGRITPKDKIKK